MRELSDRELEQLFSLDDAAGPAQPVDAARATSIVDAALRGAGFPPAGPSGGGGGAGGAHGVRGLRAGKLFAIAGGLAAVATVALLALRGAASSPAAPAIAPPVVVAVAPPAVHAEAAAEPAEIEIDPAIAPTTPPSHRRHGARHHASRTIATTEPVVTPEAPADLLAAANAARAHHAWRDADALYARVVDGARDPLAVQTALVASASLHLEHLGDPRGATRRFHTALAAGSAGALAEDARWGIAEAARALGDTAGERRALDDFLAHHADSALAARARERRDTLRGTP